MPWIGMHIAAHIISFSLGVACLCMAVIFHMRKNYPWTKYYLVMQSSLTLIMVVYSLRLFASVLMPDQPYWLVALFTALFYANLAFLIIFIPYFTTWIIAHPWRKPYRNVFLVTSVVFFIISLGDLIYRPGIWIQSILTVIFFGVFIFCIAVLIRNLSTIKDATVVRICRWVIILSLFMIPFMILDTFFTFPLAIDTFPIYYFWLSLFVFIYLANYFLHIPEAPDDVIDPLQLKKFRITARESEIISLIKEGLTNKEIGDKLCISPYTVNNHIANIYDKTGVGSRIDLLNLMKPRT